MTRRPNHPRRPVDPSQWSQRVTETSNALDLAEGVFTWPDPRAIAESLKASAELSQRRKTTPYRSAMSMLSFYINRAGSKLSERQLETLEAAKDELRELYGRARMRPKPAARRET